MFKKALLSATALSVLAVPAIAAEMLSFAPVDAPADDAAKRVVMASETVTIDGSTYDIGFHTLARSGDKIGDGVFGQIVDKDGNPVMGENGEPEISNDNDFTSLLPVGDKIFMVNHFESRPGAMYVSEVSQDAETGELSLVSTNPVDFSAWGGLWVPCAGSVTPWGTHLGSEEYPPNARAVADAKSLDDIDDYFEPMVRFFGIDNTTMSFDDFMGAFKPYTFGYAVEVAVDEAGEPTVTKHYAMGRSAYELAYVMPDEKTVYYSDDGTNVGLYMFVADKAGDLSAGNLYAAKWNQTGTENGGSADLDWVSLGHATQDEIAEAINSGVGFYDIFETAEGAEDGTCPDGFSSVNTTDGFECLMVKDGMETVASRLETRRYTAMMGGTTEFRKEEGITFDPATNTLFVAMSEVARGMEDFGKKGKESNDYDLGGANHIKLPFNPCGTVYKLSVGTDAEIGSDFVAKDMVGLVSGTPMEYAEGPWAGNNSCDIDGIANPDNITFLAGTNTLIIGEDTGSGHQNDVIWAYDMTSGSLTRIQTTPYGSETTSPYWHHVGNFTYLTSVIQHPYGESDKDKLENPADAAAYTAYIGPFPSLKN
jgi:secreted PhoX family phosphatase